MRNPFAVQEDPLRPVPREAYGWRVYAAACSAALASAMFGYDSAFIGGTLALPSFQDSFGLTDDTYTALSANIVSTFQAGCFFGSILGFPSAEKLGRRITLILSGAVFCLGAILQTTSAGRLGMMYAGRAFTGLGVGASAMIMPIYISECSPPTIRGRLIGMFEIALQFASVCGFWINYGVNQNLASTPAQWRIPFAIQLVPGGLLILFMSLMIESPRWLVKRGKVEQARSSLCWLRNLSHDHEYVLLEMSEMKAQIEHENQDVAGFGDLKAAWKELTAPGMKGRLFMGMGMKVMQNMAGVNALNYFSPLIFENIGFTGTSTSLLATGVYGLVKAFFTMGFILFLVDTWGRRPALLTGGSISVAAMFYLGAYSKLSGSFSGDASRDSGAYVAIVMVYTYAASYAFSWNAIPWIFGGEIFPTRIRALAMTLIVSVQWIMQFVIIYSTPYMIANITYGTFFVFAASIFVSSIIVYCFMPETKGFPLEKMDLIFTGSAWAPKARRDAEKLLAEHNAQFSDAICYGKADKCTLEERECV